jgi:Dipeptidyl aminopeptidases/acylaminoacyl-peptidases
MRHLILAASLGAALLLVATSHAANSGKDRRDTPPPAGKPIPIEDFFRPPLWIRPTINPAGTHIAGLVETGDDHYRLLTYELQSQKIEVLGGSGDLDIYQHLWLDDRRILFFVSTEKLYGLGLLATEVGRLRSPYSVLQYAGATLVGVPANDRTRPLVWMRNESLEEGRDGGVAIVNTNIKTGPFVDLSRSTSDYHAALLVRENNRKHVIKTYPQPKDGIVYHYLADRQGALAFGFTSNRGEPALHRFTAEQTWERSPIDLENIDIVGAGHDPDQVVALVPGEPDTPRVLRFLDAATGQPGDVLIQDQEYDFSGGLYRQPVTGRILGAFYDRAGPQTVWFDENYRAIQKMLNESFPGQIVRIVDSNDAETLFLIVTYSDRHPATYHWVDIAKKSAGLIKNSKPWIDPARMRPMQILRYKTRDGHQLDAYVTLPEGASKKSPAPLIVLPHGGPWVRDRWGFDGEVQFLASRGYIVMQPNYRGSPGYNWKFPLQDQWEFRKMHDDVTDATKMLIASGLADPSRIAIMGGSFGAYLALSGVAHEPSLYRCAVTIAGVFDWATVMKEEKYDQFDKPSYSRLIRKLGDPKQHKEKFDAISPLRHVANVRVPIFVAHGKEDRVAAISESKRLVDELERHRIPHEKLFVSGEGHGMAHLENQIDLYRRIETFLATHLAAPASSAGSR